MTIYLFCECGRKLTARKEYAEKQAICPTCGRTLEIPAGVKENDSDSSEKEEQTEALPITEFLEAPQETAETEQNKSPSVLRRMFEAMLDPQSIQWMLMIGGGLLVLGLIILLINWLDIETPYIIAGSMGIGTLSVMAGGWFLSLKTRHQIAGRALTFLGCVVAPLNLWYYHAQGLVTLENHLWIGGVLCSLMYIATVRVLRDPLFMYAVEVGVTLTVLLFLPVVNVTVDATTLSMTLMALALISVHSERAFTGGESEFSRKNYGMTLFWSGQAQAAASLLILLSSQLLVWVKEPLLSIMKYQVEFQGNLLTDRPLVAGCLWLVGAYLYLYSDLVVRRVGFYIYAAAFSLLMGVVTLIGWQIENLEWIIIALSLMALGANLARSKWSTGNQKFAHVATTSGLILSGIPLLLGMLIQFRTHSFVWLPAVSAGGKFVVAMLVVAVCNRISSYLLRKQSSNGEAVYLFFSAAGVLLAAVGVMPLTGLDLWYQQAPLLMLIPIAYVIGSRLWRGYTIERALYWVGQTATALILMLVVGSAFEYYDHNIQPVRGEMSSLSLGLVFAQASLFYVMAGLFRSRGNNAWFAALAACGAVWQWLAYAGVAGQYHTVVYAGLGVVALAIARRLGIEQKWIFQTNGVRSLAVRGRGLTAFQSGNAIFLIAVLCTFWQGITRLILDTSSWTDHTLLLMTTVLSAIAVLIVPKSSWRRVYGFGTFSLAALTLVSVTIDWLRMLSLGERVELICVVSGITILIISHIARFREEDSKNDMVDVGLLFGSILAVFPLLTAVIYHRAWGDAISIRDEIGLIAVTVSMLVTGISWQAKSPTLFAGFGLLAYLVLLIVELARHAEQMLSVGTFLTIIGALVFLMAIGLSVYREKILALPEKISNREGIFKVVDWR